MHLEIDSLSLVIDTGPDFRMQMLREGIKRLDAVLFTHEHKDHTAGLDDIRPFNFYQQADIPVFGRKVVLDQLQREYAYIFSDKKYPGVPQVSCIEIDHLPFQINGIQITPLPVLHYKLPVLGFRIGDFSYITDANHIPEETYALLEGTEVLVLNALQSRSRIQICDSTSTPKHVVASTEKLEKEIGPIEWIDIETGIQKMIEAKATSQKGNGAI